MICPNIDSVWSIDLADMQNIKSKNSNFRYILIAVDCLSKMLFTRALKNKTQLSVKDALLDIFKETKRQPEALFADRGLEFNNSVVKTMLKGRNIKLYHSFTKLKAFQAERYIRTLKARLYRYMTHNGRSHWVSALNQLTESLNQSYNRTIKMAPSNVNIKNVSEVWHNAYEKLIKQKRLSYQKQKFQVGDTVRVAVNKLAVGKKSYTETYGPDLYKVKAVKYYHPVFIYSLEDENGIELEGGFYESEITKVKPPEE